MPDQSPEILKNDRELPSLPSIRLLGQAWEYRAGSRSMMEVIKKFQDFKTDESDPVKAIDLAMANIRELVLALFVKGPELFDLVSAQLDDDVERWYILISDIADYIQKQRTTHLTADLERFQRRQ